jgi:hypothetical protein
MRRSSLARRISGGMMSCFKVITGISGKSMISAPLRPKPLPWTTDSAQPKSNYRVSLTFFARRYRA